MRGSNLDKIIEELYIEEYVPIITPKKVAKLKLRSIFPPNNINAVRDNNVSPEVIIVLLNVELTLILIT